jgi:hypothetical protein
MLEVMHDRSTPTCLVVRCGGKISEEEYAAFRVAIDEVIQRAAEPSAVFVVESSPGYGDSEVAREDLSFGTHEYRQLRRAAFVGDVKWVNNIVKAFSWLTRTEERVFEGSDLEQAIQWACSMQ